MKISAIMLLSVVFSAGSTLGSPNKTSAIGKFDECQTSCCSSSSPNFYCQICCPLGTAATCLPSSSQSIGICRCGSASAETSKADLPLGDDATDDCGIACCSSNNPNSYCQICCPLGTAALCLGSTSLSIGSCQCTSMNLAGERPASTMDPTSKVAEGIIYASFAMACTLVAGGTTVAVVLLFRNCQKQSGYNEVQL